MDQGIITEVVSMLGVDMVAEVEAVEEVVTSEAEEGDMAKDLGAIMIMVKRHHLLKAVVS